MKTILYILLFNSPGFNSIQISSPKEDNSDYNLYNVYFENNTLTDATAKDILHIFRSGVIEYEND